MNDERPQCNFGRNLGVCATLTLLMACLMLAPRAVPAAATVPLRRGAFTTVAFATDGGHYAAWQERRGAGRLVVIDTRSGARRQVMAPPTCELYDHVGEAPMSLPAAGGRFLLACNEGRAVFDARGDGFVTLPPIGPFTPGWLRVGLRYAEGQTRSGCQRSAAEAKRGAYCLALYDLATGSVSYRSESQPVDLDRPGAPAICPALRRRLISERAVNSENLFSYSDGRLAHRGRRVGDVQIDSCSGRHIVVSRRGEAQNIRLSAGVLSWDNGQEGGGPRLESHFGHASLVTYRLSTRRRRSWRLPRLPLFKSGLAHPPVGAFGFSSHNADRVFWIAAQTLAPGREPGVETSSIYSASLR
jgi:hypothetical protein